MCESIRTVRELTTAICSRCERRRKSDSLPQRIYRQGTDRLKAFACGEGVRRFSDRGTRAYSRIKRRAI